MTLSAETGVALLVSPTRALTDSPVQIVLSGVEAGAPVSFSTHLVDDYDRAWEAQATFKADRAGTIDVSRQAPLEGTYAGIDAMGLFWSMAPADGRMVNGIIKNSLSPTIVTLTARRGEQLIASAELERLFIAESVERVPVRERGLVGTLFLPPGVGPFPGMLVFTGSGGGIEEGRAALLASHGFAAFALAYFRAEGLGDSLIDIPLEYFEEGLTWTIEHPRVRGDRIGVTGGSRGGELSLLLGSTFPTIKAVVANVPSAVVWGGFGKGTDELAEPAVAWTHHGRPVPAMRRTKPEEVVLDIAEGDPIPLTPYFLKALECQESIEMASIPLERIQGPVMLISGEADAMWPSAQMADMAFERLKTAGHPYADVHLKYPNAGHGIKPPYAPTTVTDMEHPVDGGLYALGGTAEGNAQANADSWPRMLAFLGEHLGRHTGNTPLREGGAR